MNDSLLAPDPAPDSAALVDQLHQLGRTQRFATVLADPPWRFANRTGKVAPEHRRLTRYPTMDVDAIGALPVAECVQEPAHLYLWVPNALLPWGLQVMNNWGFCVGIGTRVLTEDMRWLPAEELVVGQKLLAFDEYPVNRQCNGSNGRRYYRKASVVSTGIERMDSYRIILENGQELIASSEHPWLMRTAASGREKMIRWIATRDLPRKLAHHSRRHPLTMPVIAPVCLPDRSYAAGFLSAAFDSEGNFRPNGGGLAFAQKTNALRQRVKMLLEEKQYAFGDYHYDYNSAPQMIIKGGLSEVLRFLMENRPPRLLDVFKAGDFNASIYNRASVKIEAVEYIGDQDCVTLMTDTGTYIAEGFGAHNTYKTNIVWHKLRQDGGSDGRGVGFYFRNVTELLLFGVRGKHARTLAPGRRQVNYIGARKREHSRKPDEQYTLIEQCSRAPYLELFARGAPARPGWTAWGDQAAAPYAPTWDTYAYNSATDATISA